MRTRSAAALLLLVATPVVAKHPEIAITIDDLPVHAPYPPGITPLDVNREMIAALKASNVPVSGFVNAVNVQDLGTRQALEEWHTAGFVLGNHTWSHVHLSELTIAQFEDELTRDEPALTRLGGGSDWRWFRYPFLDEGKDEAQRIEARRVLAKHGYRVAAVTMSFSDWAFTPAYARCAGKGDKSGTLDLERLYLQSERESVAASRDMAHKLYGRDIPYVLLMHVSALSAHMMLQVISLYRAQGFRFVALPEAERDPAYAGYTDLRSVPPLSQAELAQKKHVEVANAPDHSAELTSICA